MQDVLGEFEVRVEEVDAFFKHLELMETPEMVFLNTAHEKPREIPIDSDVLTMLKAMSFLVIYNLVEASIVSAFTSLYDRIRSEGRTLDQLRNEVRAIWVRQQHLRK